MVVFEKIRRLRISARLSSVVGAALVALCVMGAIAVFAAREVQYLGQDLYDESAQVSTMQMAVSVAIERAIGEVHSAPSELDLERLKAKWQHFRTLLADARTQETLALGSAAGVRDSGAKIATAITAFEDASKKVFDLAASFAQPDAIKALQTTVGPAESALEAALKEFHEAADRNDAAKVATIQATIMTIAGVVVGFAVLLVVGIAALAHVTVSRGVVRPIVAINGVMMRLSSGDAGVEIPYSSRLDEIGDMAKAVRVFKDNMVETERLRAAQQAEQQREVDRAKRIEASVVKFERSFVGVVNAVTAAATELETTAASMAAIAEETTRQATTVAAASEQATNNVRTVAAATEELSASIKGIGSRVGESARIVDDSVRQAGETNSSVQSLAGSVMKIGDVVKLINDIASQTNLLALNATIEAARAGDAGKGFAVVASEVKALANQTARATDDIAAQIRTIQDETTGSVRAIEAITKTIGTVRDVATAISAAVEEQGATTQDIARNLAQAAQGTSEVSSNIDSVREASQQTGTVAAEVLSAANKLSRHGETLKSQVDGFLRDVRAA